MESLKIAATNNTPEIDFDHEKGSMLISGRCFTQNILDFYAPIKKWVEDYLVQPKDATTLDLKIEYMNSASTVIIANLLKRISLLKDADHVIKVNWYYIDGEEDMIEVGKELEVLVSVPFNFVVFK